MPPLSFLSEIVLLVVNFRPKMGLKISTFRGSIFRRKIEILSTDNLPPLVGKFQLSAAPTFLTNHDAADDVNSRDIRRSRVVDHRPVKSVVSVVSPS